MVEQVGEIENFGLNIENRCGALDDVLVLIDCLSLVLLDVLVDLEGPILEPNLSLILLDALEVPIHVDDLEVPVHDDLDVLVILEGLGEVEDLLLLGVLELVGASSRAEAIPC